MLLRHGPQITTLIQISIYQLLFYTSKKKNWNKRAGILIYSKNDIKFKIIKHLSVSDGNSECVTVEIENNNSKNLLITCCYRTACGAIKGINSFLENVFKKANTENEFVLLLVISI